MSRRYVWEKWNAVISDYTYTGKTTSWRIEYHDSSGGSSSTVYKNGTSFNGGNYNAGDYFQLDSTSATKYYASAAGKATVTSSTHEVGEWYTVTDMAFSAFLYQTRTPIYKKGTTQYDNVTSNSRSAYLDDGASENYWYIYKGTDLIDASMVKVTYSSGGKKPVDGDTVTVTITASSRIKYGGTVSYTVEYGIDGDYTELSTGTSLTREFSATTAMINADAFTVRVKSKDDSGFVSLDYIYSSGNSAYSFDYDRTSTSGVWEGFASAMRIISGDDTKSSIGSEIPQIIVDGYQVQVDTIDTACGDLASALTAKGIDASASEGLNALISKVDGLGAWQVELMTLTGKCGWEITSFSNDGNYIRWHASPGITYTIPADAKIVIVYANVGNEGSNSAATVSSYETSASIYDAQNTSNIIASAIGKAEYKSDRKNFVYYGSESASGSYSAWDGSGTHVPTTKAYYELKVYLLK